MREFNTSGPNNPKKHYTLQRQQLIDKGMKLVEKEQYFTIWAPRQTGKSTYLRLLAKDLATQGGSAINVHHILKKGLKSLSYCYARKRNM